MAIRVEVGLVDNGLSVNSLNPYTHGGWFFAAINLCMWKYFRLVRRAGKRSNWLAAVNALSDGFWLIACYFVYHGLSPLSVSYSIDESAPYR